jgi:hypothetical protein
VRPKADDLPTDDRNALFVAAIKLYERRRDSGAERDHGS